MFSHQAVQRCAACGSENDPLSGKCAVVDKIEKMLEGACIRRPVDRRPDNQHISRLDCVDDRPPLRIQPIGSKRLEENGGSVNQFYSSPVETQLRCGCRHGCFH
jgi:hypothetical protein